MDNKVNYKPGMPCRLLLLKLDAFRAPLDTRLIRRQLDTKALNIRILVAHSLDHLLVQQNGYTYNSPILRAVG